MIRRQYQLCFVDVPTFPLSLANMALLVETEELAILDFGLGCPIFFRTSIHCVFPSAFSTACFSLAAGGPLVRTGKRMARIFCPSRIPGFSTNLWQT